MEINIVPAGGVFFTEDKDTTSRASATTISAAGVVVNFNRYVGVEGEVSGALGVFAGRSQFGNGLTFEFQRTPHLPELQRQPRDLCAESELGRAVRHWWRRRTQAVRAGR